FIKPSIEIFYGRLTSRRGAREVPQGHDAAWFIVSFCVGCNLQVAAGHACFITHAEEADDFTRVYARIPPRLPTPLRSLAPQQRRWLSRPRIDSRDARGDGGDRRSSVRRRFAAEREAARRGAQCRRIGNRTRVAA